jgi:plastocyanin
MQQRSLWAVMSVLIVSACGGGTGQPGTSAPDAGATTAAGATAPAAKGTARVDPAVAGTVSGTVTVEGNVPKNEPIRMGADPVCMRENPGTLFQESYIVGENGALANVFVYLKEGLEGYAFDPPSTPVVLDQTGCVYRPHVFGVQVGQKLEINNLDPTLHNIHAVSKANQEFNTGQPLQGMKYTHTFKTREIMVPFKCDVHGWMNAYAGVLEHPCFGVTGADGTFTLNTLPPGTYTVEAWHEKLGAQTQTVTVTGKETPTIAFTFKIP